VNTAPLVSVVIPTRDRNVEVRRAIASALRQTLSDVEIIVVDDGSVDPTSEVVGSDVNDSRLTFHRNESATGPSAARNTGTGLARGSFVAYLDSDDEWHPTKLERQVAALGRPGYDAGLSLCGYEVVSGDHRRARVPREIDAGNTVELLDTRHEPIVTSLFVLPITVARAYAFDGDLTAYEDLDLAAQISATHDIVTTRSILVRKHISAERQFSGPRIIDARRAFLAKYADVLRDHPAVLARNEITIAAELARSGRTDEARALLAAIDSDGLSPWARFVRRVVPHTPTPLGTTLDALRLVERFSSRGALWRVRTSRLRWQS
jgi:glycosyltransferase involved in cell wall biosynthesis